MAVSVQLSFEDHLSSIGLLPDGFAGRGKQSYRKLL